MRKLFVVTLLVLSILLGTLPAFSLETTQKIYDNADLLTGEEERNLEKRAREIAQEFKFDIVVVTTDHTGDKNYIEYAEDFYDNNGFGYGSNADGILFLMDMESGMPWLTYRGRASQVLNMDDVLDAVLDPYFDGHYYEAANAMMDCVSYYLSREGRQVSAGIDTSLKVYDETYRLSSYDLDTLRERARNIAERFRMDVVVVITDDTRGKSSQEFAEDFYDENGFGYGDSYDGILLLIDLDNRMAWITTGGTAISIFTSRWMDDVLDPITEHLKEGRYFQAADVFLTRVGSELNTLQYGTLDTELKVYDDADLFTEDEERELGEWARKIAAKRKMDVVVVTTDDTMGKSSMAYADDFFDYNGFGYGPDYDGVLLLINMEIREVWISTSGRGISAFTDETIDKILDEMEPPLRDNQFYKATRIFLKNAEYYASHGFRKAAYHIPGLAFISLIVAALAVIGMAAQNKAVKTTTPDTYLVGDSVRLRENRDIYIRTSVTTRTVSSSSSGSGSGRSSTHRSSSGRTHGGGGRRF